MILALCAAGNGIGRWEAVLIAAAVSACVALLGIWQGARTARQDRQRRLFGEALAAVMEYREYPYIVRRRASDEERSDISRALSGVQGSLNRYIAILTIESRSVGNAYALLVEQTRAVAGPLIAEGWDQQPRPSSADMRVSDVDLSELMPVTDAFIRAAKRHLRLLRIGAIRQPKASPSRPLYSAILEQHSDGSN